MFRVSSSTADFRAKVTRSSALLGASERKAVGYAPKAPALERPAVSGRTAKSAANGPKMDPLDDKLWGLSMIRADRARKIQKGDRGVTVGVLDTGLDASNPDLAPHFSHAHRGGVTLFGALGNNHEDLGNPRTDVSSPDYGAPAYSRPIDNSTCWDLPVEGPHVIGVSAVGPSKTKADYSNYGEEQISVAAPGGWFRDGFGTPTFQTPGNEILSTYPLKVLQEEELVDADGNVVPAAADEVFKDCTRGGDCGYYTYLQGTSMASPHAAGVGALIVSEYGRTDRRRGGMTMNPNAVESRLNRSAAETPCPTPRLQSYVREGRSTEFDALCTGGRNFNGFYGHGIVDAYAAVGGR